MVAGTMTIPLVSLSEASLAGTAAAGCWAGASWDPSSTLIGSVAAHSCHWPLAASGSMQVCCRRTWRRFYRIPFLFLHETINSSNCWMAWWRKFDFDLWQPCPPDTSQFHKVFLRLSVRQCCLKLQPQAPGRRTGPTAPIYSPGAPPFFSSFFPFFFILTLFQCPEITKTGH